MLQAYRKVGTDTQYILLIPAFEKSMMIIGYLDDNLIQLM